MSVLNGREQFEKFYREAGGCLLASVKEAHWRTWLAAQVALLEAHGPAVEMRVLPSRMAMQEPE
jgi:hypothetical protein